MPSCLTTTNRWLGRSGGVLGFISYDDLRTEGVDEKAVDEKGVDEKAVDEEKADDERKLFKTSLKKIAASKKTKQKTSIGTVISDY